MVETDQGAHVFRIPLQVFPILRGYAYVALAVEDGQEYRVLIDTGSGIGASNQQLEASFERIGELTGRSIGLQDLTHVLITHGHIDHSGGLAHVRRRTQAAIGVHELDLRNLTNYEERVTVVSRRLTKHLFEAGVSASRVHDLIEMYTITKSLYHSVEVDFTFEAAGMRVGPFRMLHVPGHCAGHVAIRLHDVLFSGDHVLEDTSPHQSPEHLTLSTGLDHYLKSLAALEAWASGVRLTLGGHKEPITDLPGRIAEIRQMHCERLNKVLAVLSQPKTIAEVAHELFGEVHGYNALLALEEAGAHVEYLDQRGQLRITNLEDIAKTDGPYPILYQYMAKATPAGSLLQGITPFCP